MAYIAWDAKLSTGVKTIDDQHKVLVALINELHDAMSVGKGKQVIADVLKRLIDYTVSHFSTEEKFMTQYGYPQISDQKSEHSKFVDKVSEFQAGFNGGKITISLEVMFFLKDWLVNHILSTDKKMGVFLSDKGVK